MTGRTETPQTKKKKMSKKKKSGPAMEPPKRGASFILPGV
jgi:hypothetical protein